MFFFEKIRAVCAGACGRFDETVTEKRRRRRRKKKQKKKRAGKEETEARKENQR